MAESTESHDADVQPDDREAETVETTDGTATSGASEVGSESTDLEGAPEDAGRPSLPEERAVPFESATAHLSEVFDVDARQGETITDLETRETDEGRRLVAEVSRSRRTAVRERIRSARRTGRRVGTTAGTIAILLAVAYGLRRGRRRLGRRTGSAEATDAEEESETDISIDEPKRADGGSE
jgi:hypothetical protein